MQCLRPDHIIRPPFLSASFFNSLSALMRSISTRSAVYAANNVLVASAGLSLIDRYIKGKQQLE